MRIRSDSSLVHGVSGERSAGRCYGQGPEIRSGASRDYREPHRGRRAAPDPSLSPGLVVDGSTARRVALRPQSHAGGVPFLPADPGRRKECFHRKAMDARMEWEPVQIRLTSCDRRALSMIMFRTASAFVNPRRASAGQPPRILWVQHAR